MIKISNFKFQISNSQKGVTIVELLLYMGILSILLMILTSIFVQALDVQAESNATSGVQQDGNYILARIAYDTHRASSLSVPSSSSFQLVIGGVNYNYSVDGNSNMIIVNNLGTFNLNSYGTTVSNFSAQKLTNGIVEDSLKINFTLTGTTKRVSGSEVKDFQTNLTIRRQ